MWVFPELVGAAVRRNPNETQLFKTEQAEEGEYAGTDALVREILQNSMDAGIGTEPVRLRLALHTKEDLPSKERLKHYFRRLESPLQQREISFSDGVPELSEGFLVCEDFGTRGLCGDPFLSKDPQPGSQERQDFFWFWRNIGRSGKTGDDLGRWGLGKTVYRAASQVGCMLGLTVRHEDCQRLLMGQAVLNIHELDGIEYVPEGYWCANTDDNGVPVPIDTTAELEQFQNEWKLARKPDEPGLSVVVPYVAAELKPLRLLQAICAHFFVPILQGHLIVDVITPDSNFRHVHLDHKTLGEWCQALEWDGSRRTKRHVSPPIQFATRCLQQEVKAVPTELLGQTKLPELNEESFSTEILQQLRDDFASEKLVLVKVRMLLPRKLDADVEGELFVGVQRRPEGERSDTYYVREGMTITKLNSAAGRRGIDAFVNVEQYRGIDEKNPLASLLGDSEGPAHEDWDTSEERPNRTWKVWKGRVKFCRRIVDHLVELLTPPTNTADFDLLADFFSVEKIEAPQKSRRPEDRGTSPPDFGSFTNKATWYRLEGRRGGFRIASVKGEELSPQTLLQVSVAYDLPSGNPLKKWSAFDFEFGPDSQIRFKGKNVEVDRLAGNILLLKPKKQGFTFTADGFDVHRDLFVRVDEVAEVPATEESES